MKAVLVALVLAAACVLAAGHQAHAEAETQTLPTEQGTIDVHLEYDAVIMPGEETKIKVEFLNPVTGQTQVHIDYTITITRDGEQVFGPTDLIHTSPGTITLPVQFQNAGVHSLGFTVEGIWFQPIPAEAVSFEISVGEGASAPAAAPDVAVIPPWVKSNAEWWADGLIDDATFVSGIEYLIQNGILVVPPADPASDPENGAGGDGEGAPGPQIPPWVKSNAEWWADGLIDDATFVGALQFLITAGIIQV